MNYLFIICLAGYGAPEFRAVCKKVIDSSEVPAEIKPIFEEFKEKIDQMGPCVADRDVKCFADSFVDPGIKGMKKCVKVSTGKYQRLCQKMLILDEKVAKKLQALNESEGEKALQISNNAFHTKADWIEEEWLN